MYVFLAELFPIDARSELTGLTNCFGNCSMFLVVKTFPKLRQSLGLGGAYWFYACVGALNVVFGFCVLPETKGKHLEEIQNDFDKVSEKERLREVNAENSV